MRKMKVLAISLVVVLVAAVACNVGPGISPLPNPPQVDEGAGVRGEAPSPEPPVLEKPTEVLAVLGWLASGGAGPAMAFFLAKLRRFQQIKSGDVKLGIVLGCIVLVPLCAQALIDLMPASVWSAVQPYWAVGVGALVVGWPASQIVYEAWLKKAQDAA